RTPASCSRTSRSTPTAAPRPAAIARRSTTSQPSRLTLFARSIDRIALHRRELVDPGGGQVEQSVELVAVEPDALGGRLHLDEAAVAGQDHVEVDVRVRVLRVVQVEQLLAVEHPD